LANLLFYKWKILTLSPVCRYATTWAVRPIQIRETNTQTGLILIFSSVASPDVSHA